MKYIFLILMALSMRGSAQNIDTVLVRNLTLQAQDWAYLVGSYDITVDSVAMLGYRRIRDKVQSAIPQSWTVNITIDSIPGRVAVEFYRIAKVSAAGEIASRYTVITSALAAKINISYWAGYFDSVATSEFIRKRDKGKNLLID